MPINYLQSNAASSSPTSVSYTNAVGIGDLLVCAVTNGTTTVTAPTSTGETWVDSGLGSITLGTASIAIFYVANCSAHAASYAVTVSGNLSGSIYEFSGVLETSPKDTTNSNANASSTAGSNNETANSITPAQAGELFLAYFATINGPLTPGTTSVAWSSPTGNVVGMVEYFIATNASAVTANATSGFGSGDTYSGIFITFKPIIAPGSMIISNRGSIGPTMRI